MILAPALQLPRRVSRIGPRAMHDVLAVVLADRPRRVGDGRQLQHDRRRLGLGRRLFVREALLLGLEVVRLLQRLFELGTGAALELALQLADLVADLPLLGAQLVSQRLRPAAALVRGQPGVDEFGRRDALDARGLPHGLGMVSEQLRVEHRWSSNFGDAICNRTVKGSKG